MIRGGDTEDKVGERDSTFIYLSYCNNDVEDHRTISTNLGPILAVIFEAGQLHI